MELTSTVLFGLAIFIFFIAALYSSVGHGGASGYLAVLSFIAVSTKEMSTTALILNVLVSSIATISYMRAGHFSFSLIFPFLIASIPAAFIGGTMQITGSTYFALLAIVLIIAAMRMALPLPKNNKDKSPGTFTSLVSGGGIGLLSGIVGVGGGIFLSPLMIFMGWADPKRTAATAAFFILVNSIAGLCGRYFTNTLEIGSLLPLLITAFFGGLIGSYFGANILSSLTIRRSLAIVLVIASIKSAIKFFELSS